MFDVFATPIGLAAGRKLALSAMPDAPVIPEGHPRATTRLRGRIRSRRQPN